MIEWKRPYRCPNCGKALREEEHAFRCESNHSFDIAKSRYVNLMLANQGRRKEEGDSKESILARKRFLGRGVYAILQKAIVEELSSLCLTSLDVFADVACGEGYYTNEIAASFPCLSCLGIDISKAAILEASKASRRRGIENISYAIGNMDYLPILDHSVAALLNCFAPIAEKEFARVLREGGHYLRVLPGERHLYEFKEVLYPEVHLNVEKEKDLPGFSFLRERRIETRVDLDGEALLDLFAMTPYAYKTKEGEEEKLANLSSLDLQLSFLLRVYRKD